MKEVIVPADDLVCINKEKLQEVIRCKDCAKCGTDDCAMRFEDDDKVYQWNTADDFCSWAERKENDNQG